MFLDQCFTSKVMQIIFLIKFHTRKGFVICRSLKNNLHFSLSKSEDWITKAQKTEPFLRKSSHGLHQHHSVGPVLLRKENHCVFVDFFMNSTRWHQRFHESKIRIVALPLKGHKANQTKLFHAVVQENSK